MSSYFIFTTLTNRNKIYINYFFSRFLWTIFNPYIYDWINHINWMFLSAVWHNNTVCSLKICIKSPSFVRQRAHALFMLFLFGHPTFRNLLEHPLHSTIHQNLFSFHSAQFQIESYDCFSFIFVNGRRRARLFKIWRKDEAATRRHIKIAFWSDELLRSL